MEIYLIRHGITKGNEEKRYSGITDDPLTENGKAALSELWPEGFIGNFPCLPYPAAAYTSCMKRTIETADIIFPGIRGESVSAFNEYDFGEFEYKTYDDLKDDPRYRAWIETDWDKEPPGGETKAHLIKRCSAAFEDIMEDLIAKDREAAAFVIHGGCIMALMTAYAEEKKKSFEWMTKNGCGFAVHIDEENWKAGEKVFVDIRRIP